VSRPRIYSACSAWKGLSFATLIEAGITTDGTIVRVPYRTSATREWNAKLHVRGRSWWEQAGRPLLPFGLETLPVSSCAAGCMVFVCEGESDALAIREHFGSIDDQATYALGIPGAGTWRREWRRYVAPFPLVYVCPDGDEAGRRFARRVLTDVPWARTVPIPLREDTRSVIQSYGVEEFVRLIDRADEMARLTGTFLMAETVDEFERLWRGGGSADAAA
jgi:hypothetical protein